MPRAQISVVALLVALTPITCPLPACADKVLDGYAGAKYSSADSTAMDTVQYRGHKDFVLYLESGFLMGGLPNPRVVVSRIDDDPTYDPPPNSARVDTLKATLYSMTNLLDDPGTQEDAIAYIDTAIDSTTATLDSLLLGGYTSGLFRCRIEPNLNNIRYRVAIRDIQYFALEAWEPRFNFYIWGRDVHPLVERYFFVPRNAGTVRVRLETEKGIEKARLRVYRVTPPPDSLVLDIQAKGNSATGTEPAYLTSGTFPAFAGGSSAGRIYKFKLTTPPDTTKQPVGNVWVRFSRNVPPYFADHWKRLLVPVVHRQFDPVLYIDSSEVYSAYLCLDRGSPGIGSADTLKVKVGSLTATNTTGYLASVTFSAGSRQKVSGMLAQLKSTSAVVAQSTDKVDTVYVVQQPTWVNWDTLHYVMYDDWNGGLRAEMADNTNYKTIECNNPDSFQDNFDTDIQAMGVLYPNVSPNLDSVFNASPNHANVRFWKLRDEPDSGPAPRSVPVTRLGDVYGDYYARKNKPTSKMLAMNFMHGFALEEYAEGVDMIISDPFVMNSVNHINMVKDRANELGRITSGVNSMKKTMGVVWAWDGLGNVNSIVEPDTLYREAWEILQGNTAIDAIATFKWGNPNADPEKLSDFPAGIALWDSIRTQWSAFRSGFR